VAVIAACQDRNFDQLLPFRRQPVDRFYSSGRDAPGRLFDEKRFNLISRIAEKAFQAAPCERRLPPTGEPGAAVCRSL
jgi:hypothetical protein